VLEVFSFWRAASPTIIIAVSVAVGLWLMTHNPEEAKLIHVNADDKALVEGLQAALPTTQSRTSTIDNQPAMPMVIAQSPPTVQCQLPITSAYRITIPGADGVRLKTIATR